MSGGFLVVLMAGLLLIAIPSMLLLRAAWRTSGVGRVIAGLGVAFLVCLGLLVFAGEEPPSLEERTVCFFAAWGALLCLFGAAAGVVALVKKAMPRRWRM